MSRTATASIEAPVEAPDDAVIDGIAIYRVSEDGGRSAKDKLHSKVNQREAMERQAATNRPRVRIVDWLDETDVSGGTPLERRPYGQALDRVEDGEVHAILFAYRSRHDRSIVEGTKAIERMDAAGALLLVGGAPLTHATPDKWAEATMGSFMGEWQKRQIKAASAKGVARAVRLGRIPYPTTPLGIVLNADHTARPSDDEAVLAVVREAFDMRADGRTIDAVRAYLAANGHQRAYRAVQRMLKSPLYIGEIRYGGKPQDDGSVSPYYENTNPPGLGHDPKTGQPVAPVIDRAVWDQVQSMRVTAGRYAKSERLLARQEVLLCGGCGGKMIAGSNLSPNGKRNVFYRCGRGRTSDCPARAVIKADGDTGVERFAEQLTWEILADATATESGVRNARQAREAADEAADDLATAQIRLATDRTRSNDQAREILATLEADADAKEATAVEAERDVSNVKAMNAARDWHTFTLATKRGLIKSALRSITVRPGRGGSVADRCTVERKLAAGFGTK